MRCRSSLSPVPGRMGATCLLRPQDRAPSCVRAISWSGMLARRPWKCRWFDLGSNRSRLSHRSGRRKAVGPASVAAGTSACICSPGGLRCPMQTVIPLRISFPILRQSLILRQSFERNGSVSRSNAGSTSPKPHATGIVHVKSGSTFPHHIAILGSLPAPINLVQDQNIDILQPSISGEEQRDPELLPGEETGWNQRAQFRFDCRSKGNKITERKNLWILGLLR
jgi:hypothetical protein